MPRPRRRSRPLRRTNRLAAQGNPNHMIALREEPIDSCAFPNDRAEVGRGTR